MSSCEAERQTLYLPARIGITWEKYQCKKKTRSGDKKITRQIVRVICLGQKNPRLNLRGLYLPKLVVLPCPFGRLERCPFSKNHDIIVGVDISPHSFIMPFVDKVGFSPDFDGGTVLSISSEPYKVNMFHFFLLLPPLQDNSHNPKHHGNKCNRGNNPILPINHTATSLRFASL